MHILACELTVHGREGVELVLEQVLVLGVKEPMGSASPHAQLKRGSTHTRMSLLPSWATRVRLPTISEGQTRSSSIFSWTAVRVRVRGRFCLLAVPDFRFGLGRTRRWETKTTYLSESFFSSSRVRLKWASAKTVHLYAGLRRGRGEETRGGGP